MSSKKLQKQVEQLTSACPLQKKYYGAKSRQRD